jgi:hypothetical protein
LNIHGWLEAYEVYNNMARKKKVYIQGFYSVRNKWQFVDTIFLRAIADVYASFLH